MSFRWAVTIVPLALLTLAIAADRPSPVALALTPAGIVVLNSNGQILRADLQDPVVFHPICRNYDVVFDMAAGVWNGELSIFVVGLSDDRRASRVIWYSGAGKVMKQWSAVIRLSGVAFDTSSGTIYVTGGNSSIYSIPVGASALNNLVSVAGTFRIGPITIDSRHGRLFVAEIENAGIYAIDLTGRNQRRVARALGAVSALA